MKKLIVSIIILIITKSLSKTSKVLKLIYNEENNLGNFDTVNVKTEDKTDINKRQEILDSLNYLKSKKVKTNQDKESIYMLEMVLRNMK